MFFGEGTHLFHFGATCFDPSGGTENAMVLLAEGVARFDIVVEKAAVIDDAGDDVDVVLLGGGQAKVARPRLQRVQDDHGPIDE